MYRPSQILILLSVFVVFLGGLFALPQKAMDTSAERLFDSSTVVTIYGNAVTVDSLRPNMRLLFKTDQDEVVVVYVGPSWYVLQNHFKIYPNDRLTITGSRVVSDSEPVIIATKIQKSSQTLLLRNDEGIPIWSGQRNPFPLQ